MDNAIVNAISGGVLIGAAAVWLWASLGRVAGISGIAARALTSNKALWPTLFVVGLGLGGWLGNDFQAHVAPTSLGIAQAAMLGIGGLLVGFGTRLGSGCTSGHGVCGNARLSKRSISATLTFLAVGMLTATLVHGS